MSHDVNIGMMYQNIKGFPRIASLPVKISAGSAIPNLPNYINKAQTTGTCTGNSVQINSPTYQPINVGDSNCKQGKVNSGSMHEQSMNTSPRTKMLSKVSGC